MLCNSPQAEHETCDASGALQDVRAFADSHFTLILTKMTKRMLYDECVGRKATERGL